MKISEFLSKNFYVLVGNFLVYLNRRIFVMVQIKHYRCVRSSGPLLFAFGRRDFFSHIAYHVFLYAGTYRGLFKILAVILIPFPNNSFPKGKQTDTLHSTRLRCDRSQI